MRTLTSPEGTSCGTTRVLGCCTFEWWESGGYRMIALHAGAHPACVEELERAMSAQGISIALVRAESPP